MVGWSIGIGLSSLIALGVVFAFWLLPRLRKAVDTTESDRVMADRQIRVASKFKSPTEGEALALVKQALALRNPDEVQHLFRTGPTTAQDVVAYMNAINTVDGVIKDYVWLSSIDKNGLSLEGVQVNFVAKDQPRNRLAILTPDEKGVWKLDFAAFARSVQPAWPDLLERKAESGLVRVYVSKDNYYNGPFRDERKWAAYRLASPDIDEILIGYCRLDTPQHLAMKSLWERGEIAVVRATLEIRRPQDTGDAVRVETRQFEISRVLAEDWVLADKPLDERVR